MEKKALVIIPTYNEKENITRIIPEVLEKDERINVLVVDDSSPDGTGEIVKNMMSDNDRIKLLVREKKEGLGKAYIAGFKYAIEHKYDYIFEMDADFSHNPKYLPEMLAKIENCDLVVGSRYLKGVNVVNWPLTRLLLSYFANLYAKILTGLPITDCTGGFKCYRREVLENINLDTIKANGYAFQIEMKFKAWLKKFRLEEISIVFYDREFGNSKMSTSIIWEALFICWKFRWIRIKSALTGSTDHF